MVHRDSAFAAAAAVLVLAGVALGFYGLGNRPKERDLQADQARLSDLKNIAGAVHVAWENTQVKELDWNPPAALHEIKFLTRRDRIADPITKVPYEYVPQSGTKYELCAVFVEDSTAQDFLLNDNGWDYRKGRTCFSLDASTNPY